MGWTKCEKCGLEINDNQEFCESCGSPQTKRTNLASRGKRLGGSAIDTLIQIPVIVSVMYFSGILGTVMRSGNSLPIKLRVALFFCSAASFLVFNGYLLFHKGQTIGKLLVGTRIVDMQGNLPGLCTLFGLRFLVLSLINQIPILGQVMGLVNALFIFGKARRCLHDYIAGTQVIDA